MNGPIPIRDTALLVIDVQNDFCAAEGKMASFGADLSTIDAAVDRMEVLVQAARAAKIPIIFIRLVTIRAADSPAMIALYGRQGFEADAVAVCRADSPGSDYYRILPEPEDMIVDKLRYSAFYGTNLDLLLRARGIRTLIAAGVTTECCVDSTVRDGFMRDYDMFVVGDACAAYEKYLHEATLRTLAINFATVVSTDDALAAWTAHRGED